MFGGLVLALWIGIGSGGIEGMDPFTSWDYRADLANECAADVLCGPGVEFTHYTHDLADVFDHFMVGPKEYGITALPDGQLTWNGTTMQYVTNGAPGFDFTWTTPDVSHFLFLRTLDNRMYVAIEDLPAGATDGDYNDALYEVVATPEPGSLLLLGTGLAALARMARRDPTRRSRRAPTASRARPGIASGALGSEAH